MERLQKLHVDRERQMSKASELRLEALRKKAEARREKGRDEEELVKKIGRADVLRSDERLRALEERLERLSRQLEELAKSR
jgi:hypothetical protein